MPAITSAISRAFVETVKLPRPPRRSHLGLTEDTPPMQLKDTDPQALVVGSSLVAAAGQVPREVRADLVDCTLFAQLAATAAVADPADVVRWYQAYFKTLTAIGWAQSDTQFETYEFKGKNAEVHKAIADVLAALLGPQAAALVIVKAAVGALQSMNENRPWLTLFERQSKSGKSARFQIATAQVESSGLLQAALVGFSLETRSTLTQVLFFKFGASSTTIRYAAGKATIYEAALKDVRETMRARLDAYRAGFVAEVALPVPPKPLAVTGIKPPAGRTALAMAAPALSISPARVTRALLS